MHLLYLMFFNFTIEILKILNIKIICVNIYTSFYKENLP
jgi:hypothetical protein